MPRRRCVGCGRSAPKAELIRLVAVQTRRAAIDPAGTLPGRGAYLCRGERSDRPAPACAALAVRRGGIARTLRRSVQVDLEALLEAEPELVESMTPATAPGRRGKASETPTKQR